MDRSHGAVARALPEAHRPDRPAATTRGRDAAGHPGGCAAEARATELARANGALQAAIDALATAQGFDEIVPTVLRIVARTFGTSAAGYCEHGGEHRDLVRLRYWLHDGRVLRASDLLALDPVGHHPAVRALVAGTGVPPADLGGATPGTQIDSLVFDHVAGTHWPALDDWCRTHGWPLHLRVPCLAGGVARGALALFRPSSVPFTRAEIALAESLAKQLALAVEADRLAQDARDRAVHDALARERERAVHARAAELARAHDALQAVTDALATARGFDELVPAVLGVAAETFDAGAAAYFERAGPEGHTVFLRYWWHEGRALRPAELFALDPAMPRRWLGGFPVPRGSSAGETAAARATRGPLLLDHAAGTAVPEYDAWHCARGWPLQLNVPCTVGGVARGSLAVFRGAGAPYASGDVALAEGIGNQLALALEADRLARAVRDGAVEGAVARERERAAEERAVELVRSNAALRETANLLAGAPDLGQFLERTLLAIARELAADTAVVITYDAAADAFAYSAFVENGQVVGPDPRASLPTVLSRCDLPYFAPLLDAPSGYAVLDVVRDRERFWPGVAEYLIGRGLTTTVVFPIRLAGRELGQIRVAFAVAPAIRPAQAELVEALANQAALAIELTRLAHGARAAAVAGERNALAREVHDTLAQGLSGIVMQLGAARDQLGPAAAASPSLARVERLAREHLAEARRSIAALRPDTLGVFGGEAALSPAPRGLAAELQRAVATARDAHAAAPGAAAEVAVAVQGTPRRLPTDVELELLRVAQAALANALRHAHARQVRVELAFTPDRSATGGDEGTAPGAPKSAGGVRLAVVDDGRGFDPDGVRPGRFGLIGMSERAARVGAALTVVTAPGEGTEVVVMWRPAGAA